MKANQSGIQPMTYSFSYTSRAVHQDHVADFLQVDFVLSINF
jgi:hypothetical protein